MKFSIIMPMYNAAGYLSLAIDSVIKQTYPNWNLLIIDDGSVDKSVEIAKNYADRDNRIIYMYQNNSGVSVARNKGIECATGDYVLFLDSDDEILPQTLEKIAEQIDRYSPDIVVYNTYRTNKNSDIIGNITTPLHPSLVLLDDEDKFRQYLYPSLVSDMVFGIVGNYSVKRTILSGLSFRSDIIMCEDLLFDMEMYEKCRTAVCLPDYFYLYRDNPSGRVRTFNYKKLENLKLAYEKKVEFAKKHALDVPCDRLTSWFCSNIIYNYLSLIGNKRLEKEYLTWVNGDEEIMKRLAQYQNIQSNGLTRPSYKISYIRNMRKKPAICIGAENERRCLRFGRKRIRRCRATSRSRRCSCPRITT